ncbi:MAG: tetratricopeptide repeat protein [Polyangia bacterium]
MMRRAMMAALLLTGCAHKQKLDGDGPKLPPAKPEAVEAFKDGARLVRLGPTNYDRAKERLETALALDPRLWEAEYDLGWLALEARSYDTAAKHFERALSIYPRHAPSVLGLGRADDALGKPEQAAKMYRAFLDDKAKPEEAAAVRIALGGSLRRAGKLDAATETLRLALKAEPRSAPALAGLGMVYEQKGQHELAELVLRRALDIDPKSRLAADVWNNLGLIALHRRHDQEAFADFAEAAKLDPTLSAARRNRAVVYLDCGDYDKAASELREVVRSDGNDSAAWVALGVAERGRGKPEDAEKAYRKAIEVDSNGPDGIDARYDLGVLYMDFRKDPKAARDAFADFVKLAPGKHPKVADAQSRLSELAPKTDAAPQSGSQGTAPAAAPGGGKLPAR